nr:movement protein 1 [Tolivirales sp.]
MENPVTPPPPRRTRERSREGESTGSAYKEVARQAVYKEADVKENMGPSVSMTVVGENNTFTQHFHF